MNCVFCNHENVIFENELAYAVYYKYPVSEGHMLVITKRHKASFFESTEAEKEALFQMLGKCKDIIEKEHSPDGYNIGINDGEHAGQTIMHLHIHVIPRYKGDVEDPRGGVRGVIPYKKVY